MAPLQVRRSTSAVVGLYSLGSVDLRGSVMGSILWLLGQPHLPKETTLPDCGRLVGVRPLDASGVIEVDGWVRKRVEQMGAISVYTVRL